MSDKKTIKEMFKKAHIVYDEYPKGFHDELMVTNALDLGELYAPVFVFDSEGNLVGMSVVV